ncbi:histidinol-phosphate transaminase [soil metagenome]
MFDLNTIVRHNVRKMKPYSSARDEFEGEASIYIDANENNLGSMAGGAVYNRYPDPYQSQVKKEIAQIKDLDPKNIFLGNGSDEAIDLLIRMVCRPGEDEVLLFPPTYGMYDVSANLNDVKVKTLLLTYREYQLPVEEVPGAVTDKTKIVFVCTPTNPTGNQMDPGRIDFLLRTFPGLVVVDEAYQDFTKTLSWTTRLEEFPNLVVLQTFSKAWGLAGLRLGMAFASPEIISYLNKIKPPYNINQATQELALQALRNRGQLDQMIRTILVGRDYLWNSLASLPIIEKVFPSDANFILVKLIPELLADEVYLYMLNQGIVVRNRSKLPGCANTLRLSVGTKEENQKVVEAFANYKLEMRNEK